MFGKPFRATCSECNTEQWIEHKKKNLCRDCNTLRKQQLKGNKDKRNLSTFKKKSKPTGEMALFQSIWASREKKSYLSGKELKNYEGTSFFPNLFAHVLSKAKNRYPKFKLFEKNIILLTPDEHYLYDFGTEEQRNKYAQEHGCSWAKIYELKDELVKVYNQLGKD